MANVKQESFMWKFTLWQNKIDVISTDRGRHTHGVLLFFYTQVVCRSGYRFIHQKIGIAFQFAVKHEQCGNWNLAFTWWAWCYVSLAFQASFRGSEMFQMLYFLTTTKTTNYVHWKVVNDTRSSSNNRKVSRNQTNINFSGCVVTLFGDGFQQVNRKEFSLKHFK